MLASDVLYLPTAIRIGYSIVGLSYQQGVVKYLGIHAKFLKRQKEVGIVLFSKIMP